MTRRHSQLARPRGFTLLELLTTLIIILVLVGSLISILEPVMVVVLGVIVGFIVIALFMPMISLIQNISGSGGGKK